jgi:hypothetical protein
VLGPQEEGHTASNSDLLRSGPVVFIFDREQILAKISDEVHDLLNLRWLFFVIVLVNEVADQLLLCAFDGVSVRLIKFLLENLKPICDVGICEELKIVLDRVLRTLLAQLDTQVTQLSDIQKWLLVLTLDTAGKSGAKHGVAKSLGL